MKAYSWLKDTTVIASGEIRIETDDKELSGTNLLLRELVQVYTSNHAYAINDALRAVNSVQKSVVEHALFAATIDVDWDAFDREHGINLYAETAAEAK